MEGKFYEGKIAARKGKEYSRDELKKLPADISTDKVDGLSDVYNHAATVWLIRRSDRQIWIHWAPSGNGSDDDRDQAFCRNGVAGNDSEEAKAQNRRVALIRI